MTCEIFTWTLNKAACNGDLWRLWISGQILSVSVNTPQAFFARYNPSTKALPSARAHYSPSFSLFCFYSEIIIIFRSVWFAQINASWLTRANSLNKNDQVKSAQNARGHLVHSRTHTHAHGLLGFPLHNGSNLDWNARTHACSDEHSLNSVAALGQNDFVMSNLA